MVRSLTTVLLSIVPACNARVAEHAALIQSKHKQPHPAKKQVSVSEDKHPEKLQHIDKHISSLETRLQQQPSTTGPAVEMGEIEDLEDVVKLLADEFGGELSRQHDEDEKEYGEKLIMHNSCQSTKDDKLRDLVAPKASEVTKTRKTHQNCRKAEDALKKYVNDASQVANSWTALSSYKGSPNLAGNANVCLQNTGSHDTFHQLVAIYDADATSNTGNCNADQELFERAFCHHYEEKGEVCNEMDTCVSTVDLAGLKSKYEDRIKHRKAMDLTLAKLDCRLNHVIKVHKAQLEQGGKYNPNSVTDDCDSASGDASKFDITMEVPDLVTCSGDADITNPTQPSKVDDAACTAWKNQEYISPPEGQLPGDSWTCKTACVAPQKQTNQAAISYRDEEGYCGDAQNRKEDTEVQFSWKVERPNIKQDCQDLCSAVPECQAADSNKENGKWCELHGYQITNEVLARISTMDGYTSAEGTWSNLMTYPGNGADYETNGVGGFNSGSYGYRVCQVKI